MKSIKLVFIFLSFLPLFSGDIYAQAQAQANINNINSITILFTGDSFGALLPCHCTAEPYGGLPRRSTAISQIRQNSNLNNVNNVLLLDAGGAFAGGILDENTRGYELDKKRTQIALDAMQIMGYDAIAVGDEELNFGANFLKAQSQLHKLQFLSANLINAKTDTPLVKPYIIKQLSSIKVGILALTTPEAIEALSAPLDNPNLKNEGWQILVLDPIRTAKKYIPLLKSETDIIIVLSHLGEEMSRQLANQVDGIDLIINSHRRNSSELFSQVKNSLIVQTNQQSKKLGVVKLKLKSGKLAKIVNPVNHIVQELALSPNLKDDPKISKLVNINTNRKNDLKVKLDLYVMGNCPYAHDAEEVIYKMLKELKFDQFVDFHLYFIVEKDKNGTFTSLRGEEEVYEDLIQASIFANYPSKFWNYIFWKKASVIGVPWQEGAKKAQVDPKLIEAFIQNRSAESILNRDRIRVRNLNIEASPTVYINNQRYIGSLDPVNLSKAVCAKLPKNRNAPPCKQLPESVHLKDPKVDFTLIVDKNSIFSNEKEIINSTLLLFPNAHINRLEANSTAGKQLIETHHILRLPAYIFGESLPQTHNFSKIKSQIRKVNGGYLISPEAVGANVYANRVLTPNRVDLFISPFSERGSRALLDILNILKSLKHNGQFQVKYVVYPDAHGNLIGRSGLAEAEEAARQAIILRNYPDRYQNYIASRFRSLGSSYWEDSAKIAGLNVPKVRSLARGSLGAKLLQDDAKLVKELNINSDFIFLINNRELVSLHNPTEFKRLLEILEIIDKT